MGQRGHPIGMGGDGGGDFSAGGVNRGVVDADHLVIDAGERCMHFGEQRLDIAGLVVERDQHGNVAVRLRQGGS